MASQLQTMSKPINANTKILENIVTSSDESFSSSTSSDTSDEQYESNSTGKRKLSKRLSPLNKNSKRKPTRKPDPNTFNRNALMARENRRRKKEYVEKLEKEISIYRGTNKNLRKIYRKQTKLIDRLQRERKCYHHILENKSEILSFINSINSKTFAIPDTPGTSPYYSNELTNSIDHPTNNFGDMDCNLSFVNLDSWEDILGNNGLLSEPCETTKQQQPNLQEIQSNIIDEHNYFNTRIFTDDSNLFSETGVCLHFTSAGKISLEFCPSCHKKCSNQTILDG